MTQATKKQIMTSANFNSSEGKSEALKASHKAAKGTLAASGKVVMTLKQQNRVLSNYTASDVVEVADVDIDTLDFAGMM